MDTDQRVTMNNWISYFIDEESNKNIKTMTLQEQLYNEFDKDAQRKLLEEEFYKRDMHEVISFLNNYIQARPRYTENK